VNGNAIEIPMLEAPAEPSTCVAFRLFARNWSRQPATLTLNYAHIRSRLTNAWQRGCSRSSLPLANSLVDWPMSECGIGNEFALSTIERGRQPLEPTRTPQPTNWERLLQSVETARFPFLLSVCRSFTFGLLRRRNMSIAGILSGESQGHIISSIINLVCPQCGGRMSEFQCEGRCCRNWLAEWEWANQATRSSRCRVSGHAARSTR
jgi:hypothetical protein